jgi:hypothetical protein
VGRPSGWPPHIDGSAGLAAVGADSRLVGRLAYVRRVCGLLGRGAEELDGLGLGHDLDLGAAFAVPAGPLREAELADDGDLPALGEPFAAGGGQLVEGNDFDTVSPSEPCAG